MPKAPILDGKEHHHHNLLHIVPTTHPAAWTDRSWFDAGCQGLEPAAAGVVRNERRTLICKWSDRVHADRILHYTCLHRTGSNSGGFRHGIRHPTNLLLQLRIPIQADWASMQPLLWKLNEQFELDLKEELQIQQR